MRRQRSKTESITNEDEFDVIVVGAGSAGCVIASRLAEDPALRILLLEAGGVDRYLWIHVPIGYFKTIGNPRFDWLLKTDPEPELANRNISWPRGKVLGGSSSLNGMLYLRGQSADYDEWQSLGNSGWGWQDVLPLFKRAEHHVKGADDFHGVDGPLTVSPVEHDILSDAFIEAAQRHGVPPIPDFNRGDNEGASYFEMSTRRGRRVSAAKAYLRRSTSRSNLRVITDAHVNRILFDGRRAVAVEYVQAGSLVRVRARREIVLSAGALASPLILQRSGIGDAKMLMSQDIDVVEDRPAVGENFQDHLQVRLVLRSRKPVTLNDVYHRPLHGLAALTRYLVGRRGPLATGIHPAGAFLRSSLDVARPDLQIHFALVSFDRLGAPPHSYSGFTMSACQLRPESRGRVRIGGKDPFAAPQMEARYLSAEADRAILLKGLTHLRALAKLDPLAQLVLNETKPGPDCRSEDDCLSYIRQTALSVHHQVGTCRMGRDEAAVVDPRLRVRGVERLRVADGSIMPRIVSGNTNAPIIMIGEKASDLIREDLRL